MPTCSRRTPALTVRLRGVQWQRVIFEVELARSAQKDLRKVPRHVQVALFTWVEAVRRDGLEVMKGAVEFVEVGEVNHHEY